MKDPLALHLIGGRTSRLACYEAYTREIRNRIQYGAPFTTNAGGVSRTHKAGLPDTPAT
jgi:hypothetical protein